MTEFSWAEMRDRAIDLFGGDTPRGQFEEDLIAHFREHPVRVQRAIDHLAARFAEGKVRAPWAVLRKHLDDQAGASADVIADDKSERTAALRWAERWMRNAGMHYHQPDLEELYGRGGRLAPWPETKPQIVALWQSLQETVAQVEADQAAYDEECRIAAEHQRARRPDRFTEAQREVLARHALADTEALLRETDPAPEPELAQAEPSLA